MKDRTIILSTVIIIVLSISILVLLSFNKPQQTEEYNFPTCGNEICERGEEAYCLDCNLSCKSEFCNPNVNIICEDCSKTENLLLPKILENQLVVYKCLSDYYGYQPTKIIYHTISNKNESEKICEQERGCYVSGGGFSDRDGIKQDSITGLIRKGQTEITKEEDVGFETHELSHAFTLYGLGKVPSWFNEGIAIYSESKSICGLNPLANDEFSDFVSKYVNASSDVKIPDSEYDRIKRTSHGVGILYFSSLYVKYGCDKICVSEILRSLYEYRKNCVGNCFENAKENVLYPQNLSLRNKDLTELFLELGIGQNI